MNALRTIGDAAAPLRNLWQRLGDLRFVGAAVKGLLFGLGAYVVIQFLFGPPIGVVLYAGCLGSLYGLLGVGIILIYRTNRIINFAAGSMGAVPAVFTLTLMTQGRLSYWLAFPLCLVMGAAIGALADLLIVRKFKESPRLILTVVTIGIAQMLAFIAFRTPDWLGVDTLPDIIRTPIRETFNPKIGTTYITGDYFLALGVVMALAGALTLFFKFSRMGIAVRASAENADRALMLGIPVMRVETVAWTIAGFFAAATVFLRGPLVGLPLGGLSSAGVILFPLAAAVIGKMENIPVCLGAGIALGVLDQASVFGTGRNSVATAYLLIVILAALLLQRGTLSRAYDTGVSSFRAVKELRPVPPELRSLSQIKTARAIVGLVVAAFFLSAPFWLGTNLGRGTLVLIYAIVGVSLVILTGWAGQISLGQFAFVGIGAAVGGGLAANHNIDIFVCLIVGGLAGALAAVIIGVPALRVQGLFLAVTTLAFAATTEFYLLNDDYWFGKAFLPDTGNRILRPVLWNRFDLSDSSGRPYYYFCLAFLVLAVVAASAFRKNRSGRVIMAVRDNTRAAASYSINPARTRLAAFAVSGFLAAIAGVLLAYQSGAVDAGDYGPASSIQVFIVTVIGGMGSLSGAILGGVVIQGVDLIAAETQIQNLDLLVTAPGLITVLQVLPGGFAEGVYNLRDRYLRSIANKHNILVPSLVADRRIDADEAKDDSIVTAAEHHVEEVESFEEAGVHAIVCPVCGAGLSMEEAASHDHLQPAAAGTSKADA